MRSNNRRPSYLNSSTHTPLNFYLHHRFSPSYIHSSRVVQPITVSFTCDAPLVLTSEKASCQPEYLLEQHSFLKPQTVGTSSPSTPIRPHVQGGISFQATRNRTCALFALRFWSSIRVRRSISEALHSLHQTCSFYDPTHHVYSSRSSASAAARSAPFGS